MKKTRLFLIFFTFIVLLLPLSVFAFEVKTNNAVYVKQDEIINTSLYAISSSITIDGVIEGDLICAAQTININGSVKGDVICAGENININGEIGGSLRAAGATINISNNIEHNAQLACSNLLLGDNTNIGWDLFVLAGSADVRGAIKGDLHGTAGNIIIGGKIGNDVKLRLGKKVEDEINKTQKPLNIEDQAEIGGNVYYVSSAIGAISEQAKISGKIGHSFPAQERQDNPIFGSFWSGIYSIFAHLVIGLVLIHLFKKPVIAITDQMFTNVGSSLIWGLAAMFVSPLIIFIIFLTIIGIPLGLILFVLWLIAVYISKILVGIIVGKNILEKLLEKRKDSLIWALVIGVLITWFICSLPIIGWALSLLAIWWGLGGVSLYFKNQLSN